MVEFDTTRPSLQSVTLSGVVAFIQRSPAGGIGVVCFLVCTGFGELSVCGFAEPYIGCREPSSETAGGVWP